jgi:DNA-binding NtrC family response regulator
MQAKANLLIVDRNPHVREYLKRELGAEGYNIRLVESCREMFKLINDVQAFDLVIIDPDLPDAEEAVLYRKLASLRARIPVLIHTLVADDSKHFNLHSGVDFIEKDGNSIERLKQVIATQVRQLQSSQATVPAAKGPSHVNT